MTLNPKTIPENLEADIARIVTAYNLGGRTQADIVYKTVCAERSLNKWEALALGELALRKCQRESQ